MCVFGTPVLIKVFCGVPCKRITKNGKARCLVSVKKVLVGAEVPCKTGMEKCHCLHYTVQQFPSYWEMHIQSPHLQCSAVTTVLCLLHTKYNASVWTWNVFAVELQWNLRVVCYFLPATIYFLFTDNLLMQLAGGGVGIALESCVFPGIWNSGGILAGVSCKRLCLAVCLNAV